MFFRYCNNDSVVSQHTEIFFTEQAILEHTQYIYPKANVKVDLDDEERRK